MNLSCFALLFSLAAHADSNLGLMAAKRVHEALEQASKGVPTAQIPADPTVPEIAFVQLNPDDPWDLGVLRVMRIKAPLKRAIKVVEDTAAYVGLFDNLTEAKRTPLSGDDFTLLTETRIPLPFVANDRTNTHYQNSRKNEHRVSQFSLVESNHLASLDGASLLAANGPDESVYWQITFLKMGFGAARALPPRVFWAGNAEGGIQADWALKLRSEQPKLASAEILRRSREFAHSQADRVRLAYDHPHTLDEVLATYSTSSVKR